MGDRHIFKHLLNTSIVKTLLFNFHYFPFRQALKFPVLVAKRTVFLKLSGHISISEGARLYLGYGVIGIQDRKFSRTLWEVTGSIIINGTAIIGRGTKICVGGELYLGSNFKVTGDSTIICNKLIRFEEDVLMSWDCLVMDTDYHSIVNFDSKIINNESPIYFGNHVWIGCRTTVLKGSSIPSNSVLAAGALISGMLREENCIYGTAGKVLKESINWNH